VMDMLTFSKERQPEPKPSDLNEVAGEVAEHMQTRAEELGVTLQWIPAQDMPTLMFDPEAMHSAILNIVTNALDACEEVESAKVTIGAEFDHSQKLARLVIEDNGAGIAPDQIETIFNVFVSHKGGRGTGLGLPVSQKILEEHGGQIKVDSKVGHGSRFTLEFPANPQLAVHEPPLQAGPTITELPAGDLSDLSPH